MEIAGDLIAATSKVTGLRAKACSGSLARVVRKAPNACTARAGNRQLCGLQAGSAKVRNGSGVPVRARRKLTLIGGQA